MGGWVQCVRPVATCSGVKPRSEFPSRDCSRRLGEPLVEDGQVCGQADVDSDNAITSECIP